MPTFVVRLWLPDRPGALGAVASRIGAVRGDLVAIDILERGAGRAIDELVVELASEELVPLLVKELHEVDGVDVEEIHKVAEAGRPDPRLAALETAAEIAEQNDEHAVTDRLLDASHREFGAAWAAVVDPADSTVRASSGDIPPASWLTAFAAGAASGTDAGDVAIAALEPGGQVLVIGRPGRPLRAIERRQLDALGRVAATRRCELLRGITVSKHPSVRSSVC